MRCPTTPPARSQPLHPTTRSRRALIGIVLTATLLAGSCATRGQAQPPSTTGPRPTSTTAAPTTTTTAPIDPGLTWSDCDGGFECAQLDVPVDYNDLSGATLTLALARRPATDPERRIGSLLINPGGPGASAIEAIEGSPLPSELTARFDVVGFDPRGVGRSDPLDCHRYLQKIYDVDPTIEDAADRKALLDASQQFVSDCETKHPDLLAHLGTANVARDMDRVRAALGDEKLTYVGYSYGTSIGQQYARLFPTKVRAMVLDGVVDPSLTGLEGATLQAKGFTEALGAFITQCDLNDCGLDAPALSVVDAVLATSEVAPIRASRADRPATSGVVSLALAQGLYSETLWPQLARALRQAQRGNANGLVSLADRYLRRNPDGTYGNGFEIYFAVSCLDSAWPKEPQEILDAAQLIGALYPHFGEALVNDYVRCALWPAEPQPLPPVSAAVKGLPPIVVISTTGDPATPFESGVKVAQQIPGAVLVANDGEGHTIYAQGKTCIDLPVTAYLIELTLPTDLICP